MKRLEITPSFVALLCFLYYISETEVFLSFLILSLLHELGHLAAMVLFDVGVRHIRVGALGTVISTAPIPLQAEVLCSLAGPFVNLFCFWVLRPFRLDAALISLLLACYNLLPVYPLDGGRALRSVLCLCLPLHAAERVEGAVMLLTLGGVVGSAVYFYPEFGFMPLIFCTVLIARVAMERNYCCETFGTSV